MHLKASKRHIFTLVSFFHFFYFWNSPSLVITLSLFWLWRLHFTSCTTFVRLRFLPVFHLFSTDFSIDLLSHTCSLTDPTVWFKPAAVGRTSSRGSRGEQFCCEVCYKQDRAVLDLMEGQTEVCRPAEFHVTLVRCGWWETRRHRASSRGEINVDDGEVGLMDVSINITKTFERFLPLLLVDACLKLSSKH